VDWQKKKIIVLGKLNLRLKFIKEVVLVDNGILTKVKRFLPFKEQIWYAQAKSFNGIFLKFERKLGMNPQELPLHCTYGNFKHLQSFCTK
jgi:hypothetical protein